MRDSKQSHWGGRIAMIAFAFLFMSVFPHTAIPAFAKDQPQSEPEIEPGTRVNSRLWVVQIADGADPQAVARAAGMELLAPVGSLPGYYIFRLTDEAIAPAQATTALNSQAQVLDQTQQVGYPITFMQLEPDDPDFPNTWHLENTGQDSHGLGPGVVDQDIDVQGAWDADNNPLTTGLSGLGVTVAAIDDGIEPTHPDLSAHYRADLDYDYVDYDDDGAAIGAYGDAHGTSVSGIIGAALDNGKCSAGIAYNAELASIRMLSYPSGGGPLIGYDGSVAASFSHRYDQIDVYNNSWGWNPLLSFNNELPLSGAALEAAVKFGRGGRGSIHVFAAGNNSSRSTNHSPNSSSRYTITVGGSNNFGRVVWYSTRGPGVFVSAPTLGGTYTGYDNGIYTTDMTGSYGYNYGFDSNVAGNDPDCTSDFGGTSAASPMVAGVVALMLEANPELTWRDVKHILAETSDKIDLGATGLEGWQTNDAGFQFSHAYGFGRANAGAATAAAESWTNVPPEQTVETGVVTVSQPIPDGGSAGLTSTKTIQAADLPDGFVVEHVVVQVDIPHAAPGQLNATLTSPSGVVSHLLRETGTYSFAGMVNDYPLLTLANWGEDKGDLTGTWTLKLNDRYSGAIGQLEDWRLVFYGYINSNLIAPSNLVASIASETSVTLNWFDNATTETGYRIERTTNPGTAWENVTTVAANTDTYLDEGLTTCTRYFYRVIALNGGDESSPSNTANARPKGAESCSPATLVLLRPGPGSMLIKEPEVAFSNPGDLKSFQVTVWNNKDKPVFDRTVKANKLDTYCTPSLCSMDLSALAAPPIFKNGVYEVQVKITATDDTREKSRRHAFTIASPGQPVLLTPAPYTTLYAAADLAAFEWEHLETAMGYELQLRTQTGGQQPILFEAKINKQSIATNCVNGVCSLPLPAEISDKLANQQRYEWQVIAKNARGRMASRSGLFFTLFLPSPILVEPQYYQSFLDKGEIQFVWQPVEGATSYQLNVMRREQKNVVKVLNVKIGPTTTPTLAEICDDLTDLCTYIPNADQLQQLKKAMHYWSVQVRDGSYKGTSPSWVFIISKPGGGGQLYVWNQSPAPDGQTAPSPLFGWSTTRLGGEHTLTVSGGEMFEVYTFDSAVICSPTPNLEGYFTCTVDFNNLPESGGSETLPVGIYQWFVTVKDGEKQATSQTTTFNVVEQAPPLLRQP